MWGLNASVQSFPFKIIYWAAVSVFKDSSIKLQYYFYKFKELSRKKSFSRSFQGPRSISRSIPGPCEPCPRVSSPLRMREPLKRFLLFPILLLFKYFCAKQTSEDTKYRCRNSDIYGSSPYYQSTSHWPGNRNKKKLSNCHWTRESKDNNIIISFDILALYLGYSLFADLRQNYDPLPVTTGRM